MIALKNVNLNAWAKTLTSANEKREKIGKALHKEMSAGEKGLHILYLAAAVLEGNGLYSTCAGGLAIVMIADIVFHSEEI